MYAEKLTKEYLQKLGIVFVSEDGETILVEKIDKSGVKYTAKKKLHYCKSTGYKNVILYDPDIRSATPVEDRKHTTGQFTLNVQRIVYVWFNDHVDAGLVIDHIDNNKLNNHKDNLHATTVPENTGKDRNWHQYLYKCSLKKPRKYYEDKLSTYLTKYEEAKAAGDQYACHLLRNNISHMRASLRYYDANKGE